MSDKARVHAFPYARGFDPETHGMTLRDYFAARCPAWWMDKCYPPTTGEVRDELLRRGILDKPRSPDVLSSYNHADTMKLRASIAYSYADAMLAARDK